jgi:hypothetical protein
MPFLVLALIGGKNPPLEECWCLLLLVAEGSLFEGGFPLGIRFLALGNLFSF